MFSLSPPIARQGRWQSWKIDNCMLYGDLDSRNELSLLPLKLLNQDLDRRARSIFGAALRGTLLAAINAQVPDFVVGFPVTPPRTFLVALVLF